MESNTRPSWDEYFLGLAFCISQRSMDSQTKHGAVITDSKNHIVGTGYNSFAPGLPDDSLPNTRPEKYPWMGHAEDNALLNLMVISHHVEGLRCYVTGKPCFQCIQRLHRANIAEVIYPRSRGWAKDFEELILWDDFVRMSGISVRVVDDLNLDWLGRAHEYSKKRIIKNA